ncbi:MAG: hypothetical protein QM658_14475 [Gordonia sp. (in: high G+C Gram-positive bacteria)]
MSTGISRRLRRRQGQGLGVLGRFGRGRTQVVADERRERLVTPDELDRLRLVS